MENKEVYQKIDINLVKENEWNPNKVSDENFNQLKEDIKKAGWNGLQPIIVREIKKWKFEIVDGAHRYKACKELWLKEVVVTIEELDDKDAKLTTIKMNKFRWEFDTIKLAELIVDLKNNHGLKDEELEVQLWFSKDELEGFSSVVDFDFSQYEDDKLPEIKDEDKEELLQDFVLNLTQLQLDTIKEAISKIPSENDSDWIYLICRNFLDSL